jgi:predicted ATPase
LIAAGESESGLQRIREASTAFQAQQASLGRPLIMAAMAIGSFRAGLGEEAMGLIAAGISAAETSGERQWFAELYRLRGEFLAAQRNSSLAEAEASVREALEIANRQGALSLELRAAMSLCRILQARHETKEGADVLAPVLSRLQEGLDTADLREARELLDKVGSPLASSPNKVPASDEHVLHGSSASK